MPEDRTENNPKTKPECDSEEKQLGKFARFCPSRVVRVYIYGILSVVLLGYGQSVLSGNPKPIVFGWIVNYLSICFAARGLRLWLINHRAKHPMHPKLPDVLFWGIAGLGFFGCFWAIWQEQNPKSISERPYLEPRLVIDSASQSNFLYHYQILNTGDTTAYNILSTEFDEMTYGREFPLKLARLPRDLAPGHTMEIVTDWLPWAPGAEFSKTLILSYRTDSLGVTNQHHDQFTFFGLKNRLKPGIIHFGSSKQYTGIEEQFYSSLEKAMSRSPCAVTIHFHEAKEDPTLMNLFLQSTNRFLWVDGGNRRITFANLNTNNQLIRLSLGFKSTTDGIHLLAITWDENHSILRVDGELSQTNY